MTRPGRSLCGRRWAWFSGRTLVLEIRDRREGNAVMAGLDQPSWMRVSAALTICGTTSRLATTEEHTSCRAASRPWARAVPPSTDHGLMPLVTEVLGHLLVQRRLEHVLREQLQQPVRAGQLQPASLRLSHHRRRSGLLR